MSFPPSFFDRADPAPDPVFYGTARMVTHIDEGAITAVGELYEELGLRGTVLDLMSSWVSHFRTPPEHLIVLGLNAQELAENTAAAETVVQDLNADPILPFQDASIDAATCCVSVDYLIRPVEVFREVGRVLRPGGLFVCTFSNRCFPTKASRGWLATDDAGRMDVVRAYFTASGAFGPPSSALRTPPLRGGDPLYGVWAARVAPPAPPR